MIVILFRSKLTFAAGADYDAMDAELSALVKDNPGFIRTTSYRSADGERLTVVWWRDEQSLKEWRELARHRFAQQTGREKWYEFYEMEVAPVTRPRSFQRQQATTAAEKDPTFGRLIDELAQTPAQVRNLAHAFPASSIRRRAADAGFAFVEHVCHLRDYEAIGCHERLHRMLNETNPVLTEFAGDKLAMERDYRNQDIDAAMAEFVTLRQKTVSLLRTVTTEQAARTADFSSYGNIAVTQLMGIIVEHDGTHRKEIEALLTEIQDDNKASATRTL